MRQDMADAKACADTNVARTDRHSALAGLQMAAFHASGAHVPRARCAPGHGKPPFRSEEHTSELQSLMRNSYAVFCLKKQTITRQATTAICSKLNQPNWY